ncbi:MAG: phenylalanine--tRNA ligase subunit beta [Enterobacterales bacterium]
MKISHNWINEWVHLNCNIYDLIQHMHMSGLQVENLNNINNWSIPIIVGKIIDLYYYKNNINLKIQINKKSSNDVLDVICNKFTYKINNKIAIASIYSEVEKKFKWIICKYSDLGLINKNNFNDVILLPNKAVIGDSLSKYIKFNDNIFDINILSNRSDCYSIFGIARDLSIYLNKPLKKIKNVKNFINKVQINYTIDISIDNYLNCPRYLGIIIKNINIKKYITPIWMQNKLINCGIKPINIIFDIINYIIIEFGQPIHVFDFDKISNKIYIRKAKQHEKLIINKKKLVLTSDMLVVSDDTSILSIAGVLVGSHAAINNNTKNIFLECAFFKKECIINNVNKCYIKTDSSIRYIKGVDPKLQINAIEQATMLFIKICKANPGHIINKCSKIHMPTPRILSLKRKNLNKLIGINIEDNIILNILNTICYAVSKNFGWKVVIPIYRFDIITEENLIGEIVRIYGYNNIKGIPLNIRYPKIIKVKPINSISLNNIKNILVTKGYNEVITYSFVNPKIQSILYPQQKQLIIKNPISIYMSSMRVSLITGLLNTIIYNVHRQQETIRIFESGLTFIPDKLSNLKIKQNLILSGAITGQIDSCWRNSTKTFNFYDIKSDLESILEYCCKLENIEFRNEKHHFLHPGQSASIYFNDEYIGLIGTINPFLKNKLNLRDHVFIFELIWDKLPKSKEINTFKISKFPINCRDISLIILNDISSRDIILTCKNIILDKLVDIKVIDVYRGNHIKQGYKSISIRLFIQDIKSTLKEHDIYLLINNCVNILKLKFNALIR